MTILNAVLDAGINYIDTSIDYGLSEERIGRYISHRRSEYYLASKCGCLVGAPAAPAPVNAGNMSSPATTVSLVQQERRRVRREWDPPVARPRALLSAGRATARGDSRHIRINPSAAGENASGWAER